MKKLLFLAIVLAVFAAYFIFNTEKSISIKGRGNAVPAGIDIAKSILNQALDQFEPIKSKINDIAQSKVTGEIKSKIGEIKDNILDKAVVLIKTPVENKVSELFCPQK